MIRDRFFRKSLCFLLCCCLMIASLAAAGAAEESTALGAYLSEPFTMQQLFDAAEQALSAGIAPKQILQEMGMLADAHDAQDFLECAMSNIGGYQSEEYNRMSSLAGMENQNRRSTWHNENRYLADSDLDYRVYDVPEVSEELKTALGLTSGQYCLEPFFWGESDFQDVFGKKFSAFKPASPRPGYVCVVVRDGSESTPDTAWSEGDFETFRSKVWSSVLEAADPLVEDGNPVFTGNPQLASMFWVFELKYPFYGLYGTSGEIRGYHCSLSLTVQDAKTHKTIAEFSHTNRLANTIYWWNNGKSWAEVPDLSDIARFYDLAEKVSLSIRTARSTAAASRKITVMNAESAVNALLLAQTEKLNDPWQRAIYESGARDVLLEGDTLSFRIRSYDPNLKELGTYAKAEDPDAWFRSAMENAGAWNLEIELTLEDGLVTKKSLTSLKSSVQKAASAASKAFSGKDMQSALLNRMFPKPLSGKVTAASDLLSPEDSFLQWAENQSEILAGAPAGIASAYFFAVKNVVLSGKNGPQALTMTVTGITPDALLSGSAESILDTMAYKTRAERTDSAETEKLLTAQIAEDAFAAQKKNNTKTVLTFSVDELVSGDLPQEYRTLLAPFAWEDRISGLQASVDSLPDEAAQEFPKPGRLSGSEKGTQVRFRIGDTSSPTYIVMRDADTEQIAVTLFALPGKTTTVRVPKGFYIIAWCSGPYWYGEEKLFGESGSYSKSEQVEILNGSYYHTFTLERSDDGDVSIYSANPDDFR